MKIPQLRRGRFLIAGCVGAAVVGGLVLVWAWPSAKAGTASQSAGQSEYLSTIGAADPLPAKPASRGKIRKQAVETVRRNATLRLTGSLAADEKSDVGSNASGIVSQTCVDRGSLVKKGDLMVQLDPRDSQYALDEAVLAAEQLRVRLGLEGAKRFRAEDVPEVEAAKLAFQLAEKNYRRGETLRQHNAIALSDADQMETEYRSAAQRYQLALLQARQLYEGYLAALAHVETLRKGVEDCSIRAPFDGYVTERDVSAGERVISLFPSGKLVTVLRIDPLRLSLTVPSRKWRGSRPARR